MTDMLSAYYEDDDDFAPVDIDPERTALLIIDMQRFFVTRPEYGPSEKVWLIEGACGAATMEIQNHELTVLNNIYCHVIDTRECLDALSGSRGH